MNNIPLEELLYEEEGTYIDLKREQYKFAGASDNEKSEIIKDILAFANAWRRTDAYILTGVLEVKGERNKPVGIETELDDASLQELVNKKTQKPILFSYQTLTVDGVKIGAIKIPVQGRPFYLIKDYGKLYKNTVYLRRGSSTDIAKPDEIYRMGLAEVSETKNSPDLLFEFADLETQTNLTSKLDTSATVLNIPKIKDIPDFEDSPSYTANGIKIPLISLNTARSSYYRELVEYYYIRERSRKLSFSLTNKSEVTTSDIKIEILIDKLENDFVFLTENKFPCLPKSHNDPFNTQILMPQGIHGRKEKESTLKLKDIGKQFILEINFNKAQPKQNVFCLDSIFILFNKSCVVSGNVTIYADELPEPIKTKLTIECNVDYANGSLEDIKSIHHQHLIKNYTS